MDRWLLMTARAYAPALFALVVAVAAEVMLGRFEEHPMLAGLATGFRWVPMSAFVAAIAYGTWAVVRLWRAEHGEGLLCGCGGLLGRERDGRYGPYRQCLKCSKNVAQRHYE